MSYIVTISREAESWGEDGWSSYKVVDRAVGPFGTIEEAEKWSEENGGRSLYAEHEVLELKPPIMPQPVHPLDGPEPWHGAYVGKPIDLGTHL